jgi:hypothetical protein
VADKPGQASSVGRPRGPGLDGAYLVFFADVRTKNDQPRVREVRRGDKDEIPARRN